MIRFTVVAVPEAEPGRVSARRCRLALRALTLALRALTQPGSPMRYVLLEHDYPTLHWDLMLETAGVLRTWRLAAPPAPGQTVAAQAIGDHRLAYLDYEGPVSGDRGTVKAWDRGVYVDETEICQRERRVVVQLDGTRFRGRVVLQCDAEGVWTMTAAASGSERET